jgi:integrase
LPRLALTKAAVERLKPPARGQIDYFDKGFPGLALRISYGGGKSWVFFYRIAGKLRRMTLGTFPALSLADARKAWRSARDDAQEGRDPAISRKRGKSAADFAAVAREWLQRDRGKKKSPRKPSSQREMERIVERELVPVWGHRDIAKISKRDVIELIEGIADRGSVIMARRVHAHTSRLFKWAMSRDIGVEANPVTAIVMPGHETSRDRVLSDGELKAVWKAAEKLGWPFGPAIQLLILTGARREEIGALRWGEIDIDGAEIKLEGSRTKSGDPHTIPLSTSISTVLSDIPRISESDYVFTTTGRTPVSGWSKAKTEIDAAASISPPWRLHDLRRTVATGLQKLGTGLQVVESILGHVGGSRAGVVGIYQRHTYDAEKRAALEAWGAHVMAIVGGAQ